MLDGHDPDGRCFLADGRYKHTPDGRCFLAAWAVSTSFRNVRQKPNLPTWKGNHSPQCSTRIYYSANALFRAGQCTPFRAHRQQVPKASILQLNIEGLTASKMNVLHHLAVQYGVRVIFLPTTHCTCADNLTIPGFALAGPSLSRKHGLATFVHDGLKWALVDQSPTASETEWLCVDDDGYRIVNIYKPPPTQPQASDLPVFPHLVLYSGDFNGPHANWGYRTSSADG